MNKKIAVIAGAGPAGLTAAYELLKRTDITPIVYEATDAIGGIAQTYNYKGNRIDIGGHRFFSKSKRVMDWWFNILPIQGKPAADSIQKKHEIEYEQTVVQQYLCKRCIPNSVEASSIIENDDDTVTITREAPDPEREDEVMLQRPRISRIFYNRLFLPYRFGITLRIAMRLGIINTTLIALSYIKQYWFPLKDETYLDAFYINRFGRRLYETFFKDYTEKVWGVPCDQIRADWGAQRVKGLSLKRAVTSAIQDIVSSEFKKSQQARETSLITRFFYPKYGPGQMWETVAKQVEQAGGTVCLNTMVSSVHINPETAKVDSVVVTHASGETEVIACDYFFSTMPVRNLVEAIHPPAPKEVQRIARGLIYRDFMTVGLLLKKLHIKERNSKPKHAIDDNWIYIQEGDVEVGRVQIFNNWSPYMVQNATETIWIGLEYFVNESGKLWKKADEDMIKQGIDEMVQIGFIQKQDVLDACVLRMPKAYPAYFGTFTELSVIQQYTTSIENLFLIGRNGMHRYNNQDHSMLTAMVAVDNIQAGITDDSNIWEVNAERVYHEEKIDKPSK